MAEKLTFVQGRDGVEGFKTPAEAAEYVAKGGGEILTGKAAAEHQRAYDAQGLAGAATAAAVNAGFGLPKLAIGALGSQDTKDFVRASEEAHPFAAAAGGFVAPWGAAGKLAGGAARGLFGIGEAAEAASVFGRGASVFGEGSALEGAAARGAEGLAGGVGRAEARALSPLLDDAASMARPGFAGELEGIAGRGFTAEGAALADAHPRSFLEAAMREGSLNAGVGAINSAGDYLLSERYMDGDPRKDAEGLTSDILRGALFGGALGAGAGILTHGAGKVVDHLFNPANAPKFRAPEAVRGELEAAFRAGGHSAEEAAAKATAAIEHGVAATSLDAGYNRFSTLLENARVKRALERGEIQLPPSMTSEVDLQNFVSNVADKAHAVRGGAKLPDALEHVGKMQSELEAAANERRASVINAARSEKPTPALARVFIDNPYGGELAAASAEARALGSEGVSRLLDKAHGLVEQNPNSRVLRLQALGLLEEAEAKAPPGFNLTGERELLLRPLQHEANGPKFLSALGEHQLAEKARRDLGTLAAGFKGGQAPTQDAIVALEEAAQKLGLKSAGNLDRTLREHYENEAARAIGKEAKAVDPTLRTLGGMMGLKVGGYFGARAGEWLAQAATDPVAASGVIRKALGALRYGAEDAERIAQGLAPNAKPKASLVNLAENATPLGKVLWDSAPGRTARMVGQALEDGFRAILPSMPQRAAHGLMIAESIEKHLAEHEPQPVLPKGVSPAAMANLPPRYNDREVREYQGRLLATVAPRQVLDRFFQTGYLPRETADTLRALHPTLVADQIARGAAMMAKVPESERYEMGRKLEALAGPGGGLFVRSSSPGFVSAVQASYQASAPVGPAGQPGGGPGAGGSSGNASPQGKPGPGGATYAPVTIMRGIDGKFLQQTQAAPTGALSTKMGSE